MSEQRAPDRTRPKMGSRWRSKGWVVYCFQVSKEASFGDVVDAFLTALGKDLEASGMKHVSVALLAYGKGVSSLPRSHAQIESRTHHAQRQRSNVLEKGVACGLAVVFGLAFVGLPSPLSQL